MTIKEKIIASELEYQESRYEKLKEIVAPAVVISSMEDAIEKLRQGEIKIMGETDVLDTEYINGETKKGRGGKMYVSMNDGDILYFPNGRYGRFIKRAEK